MLSLERPSRPSLIASTDPHKYWSECHGPDPAADSVKKPPPCIEYWSLPLVRWQQWWHYFYCSHIKSACNNHCCQCYQCSQLRTTVIEVSPLEEDDSLSLVSSLPPPISIQVQHRGADCSSRSCRANAAPAVMALTVLKAQLTGGSLRLLHMHCLQRCFISLSLDPHEAHMLSGHLPPLSSWQHPFLGDPSTLLGWDPHSAGTCDIICGSVQRCISVRIGGLLRQSHRRHGDTAHKSLWAPSIPSGSSTIYSPDMGQTCVEEDRQPLWDGLHQQASKSALPRNWSKQSTRGFGPRLTCCIWRPSMSQVLRTVARTWCPGAATYRTDGGLNHQWWSRFGHGLKEQRGTWSPPAATATVHLSSP